MISTWNKNIRLFRGRFPDLYNMLKDELEVALPPGGLSPMADTDWPVVFPCGWSVRPARNGALTATENSTALHSAYNPVQEADKLADSLVSNASHCDVLDSGVERNAVPSDVFVFYAFALGYTPVALASRDKSATVVLVEPDSACLAAAMCCVDFSPVFDMPNCAILVGASQGTVVSVLERYGLSRCRFIRNKPAMARSSVYFSTLDTLVERNISKNQINQRTLEKFASLWRRNSCRNIRSLVQLDGVARYEGLATNLPACVLAAGPSLDEILPHLAAIKERCLLVCVDTALRACLRSGVEPDFIVLVDPQYWNSRHVLGLSSLSSVLIAEVAAYPSVFAFPCREKVLCSSLYPVGKYFEGFCGAKGSLGAGGSVATTAWDFARLCGCPEIFIAGLDLGFPGKKTHARGSLFEERSHVDSSVLRPAETSSVAALFSADQVVAQDYMGEPLLTDSRMSLYAWWFESKVASFPGQPTYSLSSHALKIPGIEPCDVESLLSRPVAEMERRVFFEKESVRSGEFRRGLIARQTAFDTAKRSLLDGFVEMYETARRGMALCDAALQNRESDVFDAEYPVVSAKLQDIDKGILESRISEATSLVFPTEQRLEKIFAASGIPSEPKAATLFKSRIIYREIADAAKGYLSLL